MPATASGSVTTVGSVLMAEVMIGIDPHKSSHTAVAISVGEEPLGELRVDACPSQAEQLRAWAAAWPERAWAVEGAAGLGCLLAQQLVAAGEQVLDVPPKLAARVRLLQSGDTSKNDPNDAFSVAVAALRSTAKRPVLAEDHAVVLKVWAKRHRDLARARNQAACRLHAVLCDLVPGGIRKEISAGQARPRPRAGEAIGCGRHGALRAGRRVPRRHPPPRCPAARHQEEAGRGGPGLPHQLDRHLRRRPVIAGTVIGDVRQVFRFGSRDHFAACNGTAPVEVSSGGRKVHRLSLRGNRRLNHAIHMAAITQIRYRHSEGRAYYEKKLAEGKTHKEALRALKRRISDAIYAALVADARQAAAAGTKGPGGQPGNLSVSRAAGSHPAHRLFGQATPGPATTIRPGATAGRAPSQPNRARQRPAGHLATASKKPQTTT
jgi:transposase